MDGERPAGIAAACARLVHPVVSAPEERLRQTRLLLVLLAGPFLVATAAAALLGSRVGVPVTLAATCGILGVGWLLALCVATTGRRRIAEPLALAAGALAIALVTAVAGGTMSPLTIVVAGLPIEALWVARTRRALLAGAVAAFAAAAGGHVGALMLGGIVAGPSAWHWLLIAVYAATLWPRARHLLPLWSAGAREKAQPALEELMNAVVLRTNRAGDVVDVSPQASGLLGVEPEMMLGTGLFDRLHVSDRVAYLNALADIREGACERLVHVRLRLPTPQDPAAVRYGCFTAELIDEGESGRMIVVLRDDTEAAALREELSATNERAAGMEMAKRRFLASVSHELRTPLNAIIGFSEILTQNMAGELVNPRQREYVQLIREAGDHLLSVVNSILDVSKIESGSYEISPEPFHFREAVELSLSMMRQQAEAKSVVLSADIPDALEEVCFDRRAVQQILINLMSNAVKFTPRGGSVSISAGREPGRLKFEVNDTGIGMSREDLQRVGQPFMQVQNDYTRQFEGTGLGLALVKGLVTLQGGTMRIESAPGAGTCVKVSLPTAEPGGEGDAPAPEPKTAIATERHGMANETLRKSA